MLIPVLVGNDFEDRESVKDHYGRWICEGMYVNEVSYITDSQQRQGWVTETMDEKEGQGKIKVQVVRVDGEILDEDDFYETDFEPGSNWCKALVDG